MPDLVVGANPVRVEGPALITHEGGDEIQIGDATSLPGEGVMDTLHFEGVENEIEQEFVPASPAERSYDVPERGVWLTARGQANVHVKPTTPAPKPAAKKRAAKSNG